jgi:hypothetical protein
MFHNVDPPSCGSHALGINHKLRFSPKLAVKTQLMLLENRRTLIRIE